MATAGSENISDRSHVVLKYSKKIVGYIVEPEKNGTSTTIKKQMNRLWFIPRTLQHSSRFYEYCYYGYMMNFKPNEQHVKRF